MLSRKLAYSSRWGLCRDGVQIVAVGFHHGRGDWTASAVNDVYEDGVLHIWEERGQMPVQRIVGICKGLQTLHEQKCFFGTMCHMARTIECL